MRFYAFTLSGLERIAAGEISGCLPGAQVVKVRPGVVFFEYPGDPGPMLELGTVEDIFALAAQGKVSGERKGLSQAAGLVRRSALLEPALAVHRRLRPKKVRRVTFRVVVQRRDGGQQYVRQELQKRVARAVEERFPRWKWVKEDAHLEIWVLQGRGEIVCGVRLSDRTMRHRTWRKVDLPASLRPVVARSMVILSEPRDDDVFLDPMCGTGTILIERGEHGRYQKLIGGDIREEAVEAARTNVGRRYKPIEIHKWDALDLPLPDGSVDRIACNLPFGRKIGAREENRELYRRFAVEAARVLKREGVMVLLAGERGVLARAVERCGGLRIERTWPLFVLGRRAFIFKVRLIR